MESTGKYWIPVFNLLEQHDIWVTLFHPPKYTKPMKGNKTDRKDTKYMCGMVKPSFIPPADISALRDLVRYRFKLTWVIFGGQTPTDALLHGYILSEQKVIYQREVWDMKGMKRHTKNSSHFWLELFFQESVLFTQMDYLTVTALLLDHLLNTLLPFSDVLLKE